MIKETEEQALVFVKKIIREEFLKMGEIFNSRLLPTIQNVDHLFLLSDTWIRGAVNPDGPLDPSKYNVPTGQPGTLTGTVADLEAIGATAFGKSIQKAFAEMDEWPFVLERYVRIVEKEVPISPDRADNLYGVVNLQDWDAFIRSTPVDRYAIPIASAELDIPDQDFSLFDPESYDIYCLIPELIDTPEYQTMFRYVFPLSRYVSVLAIYNMTCFVDSIGNTGMPEDGGDMWENPGGNRFRGFGNWDRTEMFDKSRKASRDAFRSMYRTANPGFDPPPDQQGQAMSFLELLKPMVNFEDGLKWWQRGRRIKKKPTETC